MNKYMKIIGSVLLAATMIGAASAQSVSEHTPNTVKEKLVELGEKNVDMELVLDILNSKAPPFYSSDETGELYPIMTGKEIKAVDYVPFGVNMRVDDGLEGCKKMNAATIYFMVEPAKKFDFEEGFKPFAAFCITQQQAMDRIHMNIVAKIADETIKEMFEEYKTEGKSAFETKNLEPEVQGNDAI